MVDGVDKTLPPDAAAAVEFYIRCRIASPLKSAFNAKEIADPCMANPSTAGRSLAAMSRREDLDLEVETTPGGVGGTRYVFRRDREEADPREWWIERGRRREGSV